jgi:methyl-accepting chemotaxis protein
MMKNRRRKYLINKPLQLRYMAYVTLPLLVVSVITIASLYIGIWGSVLDVFSDERFRNDLLTASRLTDYESARFGQSEPGRSPLSFFKQTEKLSQRQREIFRDILAEGNRTILPKFALILLFIAWGSLYLSHRVAGPFYRFQATLEEIDRGNLATRVRLREGDEGRLLEERFNHTLENLDMTFSRLKHIVRENENNPERLIARLKEELSKIKTSGTL